MSWQLAFVATSVTLGESVDAAMDALGDERHRAAPLEATLRSGTREARARAIAQQLAPVVTALEAMEATWPG